MYLGSGSLGKVNGMYFKGSFEGIANVTRTWTNLLSLGIGLFTRDGVPRVNSDPLFCRDLRVAAMIEVSCQHCPICSSTKPDVIYKTRRNVVITYKQVLIEGEAVCGGHTFLFPKLLSFSCGGVQGGIVGPSLGTGGRDKEESTGNVNVGGWERWWPCLGK